ncbi:MAG TPA: hypothetical protein VKV40_14665 [Ktedonobacteraceae bacterium]|nr:hypothetical protein [Ktedonobacteraceae bacterium]
MSTDSLDTWAVKLAEVVAPEEVALAAVTVQAYVADGTNRSDLFRQSQRGTPGGFDAGVFQEILPYVLRGLHSAAPIIVPTLSSTLSGIFLEVVKRSLKERNEAPANSQSMEQLPDDPYKPLKQLIATLSRELHKGNVAEQKAELIIYHTIQAVLEDPEGTRQFLQRLSDKSSELSGTGKSSKPALMKKRFKRSPTETHQNGK